MTAPNPDVYLFFFKTALEYYVNGRAAALCGCLHTTGNLLHHAVEMILKGELSRTVPLEDLKKLGHSLPKCWEAFKVRFPTEDLTEFDPMIAELDRFEIIRYPDKLLALGAGIAVGFGRGAPFTFRSTTNPVPEYKLGIGDVDAFFARMFPLCHMNPGAYFTFLTTAGEEILLKHNAEGSTWLQ